MEKVLLDWYSPKNIILGTDGHFVPIIPETDQIWSLQFEPSVTNLFYLQTTYGLRARSMRLFPNILLEGQRLTRLVDFAKLPTVTRYTPGSIEIEYETIQGLRIVFTCFFPEPAVIVGDLTVTNPTAAAMNASIEMAATLVPMHQGTPSRPQKIDKCTIITGQSDNLWPVLFMSGGPSAQTNPHPALSFSLQLLPKQSHVVQWSLSTKDSLSSSFKSAQKILSTPWKNQSRNQQKFHEAHTLFIHTGDPDWDAALFLSQVSANLHCNRRVKSASDRPCFMESRLPDQAEPESDKGNLTLLNALHLGEVILPAHCKVLENLIESFISQIDEKGQLSTRFTRIGVSRSFQEAPLLAQLILELYEINQDLPFLRKNFPHLCRFIDSWFIADPNTPGHFRLTWEDPQQLQINTGLFNFDIWESTGKGLNIQSVESPALAAILLREVRSLQTIASILNEEVPLKKFQEYGNLLQKQLGQFWQEDQKGFVYLDRQSHLKSLRELYYPAPATEKLIINKRFTRPQRLQLHLTSDDEFTRACHIQFIGKDHSDKVVIEKFNQKEIRWISGHAHLTTNQIFSFLDNVTINGLHPKDQILLETAEFAQTDITCLSPIWSGGMHKKQLNSMVKRQLNWKKKDFQYGIPETWDCHQKLPENLPIFVNILWNTILIKGLITHGLKEQAVHLFQNMMAAIITGLKNYQGFFPFFNKGDGHPTGTRNGIAGLIPVRLFLQIAGIRLFTPNRVAIWGKNPFPWPVEITWQGLTLHRDSTQTNIIFPDGSTYQTDLPESVVITASKGLA